MARSTKGRMPGRPITIIPPGKLKRPIALEIEATDRRQVLEGRATEPRRISLRHEDAQLVLHNAATDLHDSCCALEILAARLPTGMDRDRIRAAADEIRQALQNLRQVTPVHLHQVVRGRGVHVET